MSRTLSKKYSKDCKNDFEKGRASNTTLRILSVWGVSHPPFTDKMFGKKGVTDMGGTPPPLYGHIFAQKW